MASKSSSNSNNENNNSSSSFNPLIETLDLAQSAAIALIGTYGQLLKDAPKIIEYWYNIFLEPLTKTTTTTEKEKREKVKVE